MINGYINRFSSRMIGLKKHMLATGDSEPKQITLRLFIGIFLILYFCFPWLEGQRFEDVLPTIGSQIALSYYVYAIIISLHVLLTPPKIRPVRRVTGIFFDLSFISLAMCFHAEKTVFLFVLYLWVILANGFRYGIEYLYIASLMGIAGFSLALYFGPYWAIEDNHQVALSLFLILILMPTYTSLFLKRLHQAITLSKQASEAKTRFLANMSHELRTPLNGVIGMGQLLRETPLNPEQAHLVSAMHQSAKTLLNQIESVLDISKIEAGKVVIEKNNTDLHSFINNILATQMVTANAKGLELTYFIDSKVPYSLVADQQHITQVLINLMGNAIKFTDQGSVHLKIELLDTNDNSSIILFNVIDTGIGIDESRIDNVFDDFTQLSVSSTHMIGGTGLGTTISKELVELMGGTIGVESQLGQGSRFWFSLPLKHVEQADSFQSKADVLVMASLDITSTIKPIVDGLVPNAQFVASLTSGLPVLKRILSNSSSNHVIVFIDPELLEANSTSLLVKLLEQQGVLDKVSLVLLHHSRNKHFPKNVDQHFLSIIADIADSQQYQNVLHAIPKRHEEMNKAPSLSEHYAALSGSRSLTILVAEDNLVNQQVIEGILKRANHNVIMTSDGEQALEVIFNQLQDLDLLLVDKNMPKYSGEEVVKSLKLMSGGQDLPVIMITADATPEAKELGLSIGIDEFLTKPIDAHVLLETIAELTKKGDEEVSLDHSLDGVETEANNDEAIQYFDGSTFQQLKMISNDPLFIRRILDGFIFDGDKHITIIKESVTSDTVRVMESLHALKGAANELGALPLANLCADMERLSPDEIESEKIVLLSQQLELLYKQTVIALEGAI